MNELAWQENAPHFAEQAAILIAPPPVVVQLLTQVAASIPFWRVTPKMTHDIKKNYFYFWMKLK